MHNFPNHSCSTFPNLLTRFFFRLESSNVSDVLVVPGSSVIRNPTFFIGNPSGLPRSSQFYLILGYSGFFRVIPGDSGISHTH